jgi:hypothetical protein
MKFAPGLFQKFMQFFAYLMVCLVLIGVLGGVGYLYKIEKISGQDIALGMILSVILATWKDTTAKIFRTKIDPIKKEGE